MCSLVTGVQTCALPIYFELRRTGDGSIDNASGHMAHETYRSFKEQDMAKKVIITCAITGSAHTPTMSPALPITPEEIAEQSIAAAEAGASIIHLHARDRKSTRLNSRH